LLEGPSAAGIAGLDYCEPILGENGEARVERLALVEVAALVARIITVVVNDEAAVPVVGHVDAKFGVVALAEFGFGVESESK
jgi:hypothetical protein